MNSFVAQCKAEGLRIIRSPFFLLFSILMPLGFYFLFTSLNGADTLIGDVPWGAYSLMSLTAFSIIGTAVGQLGIRIAYERKDGWLRQLRLTPLSTTAWIGAKLASHLIIHLLIILIIFPAAAFSFGLELAPWQWVGSALWLLLGSLPFLALGALIGTLRSTDAAMAISNILHMGISIAGGLWMPLATLPAWLQSIGQWLPSYRYASGAWTMISGNLPQWLDFLLLLSYGFIFVVLSSYIMNKREAV